MLSERRIVLVEDEILTAMDLLMAIEEAAGTVVGPARSVVDAIQAIDNGNIDAAVLDRTLLDGKATPVAVRPIDMSIPFIFYSGQQSKSPQARVPTIATFRKPTEPTQLIKTLTDLISRST
jgi:DNA-binding response OmpR family regulator